jgi:hypothetical protein
MDFAMNDDNSQPEVEGDGELVAATKAIMFGTHHQVVSDEQARGIIALMLGGREVANPIAYMRHALAQPDGARYGPTSPTPQPDGPDLITLRKAAMLRHGEPPAEATARAERAHRGADLCRKMLAERPRPLTDAAELPSGLHGPALAAEQLAQSRAHRDRLPVPPPGEDAPEIVDVPLPGDDEDDADEADDDDGEEFEPPF